MVLVPQTLLAAIRRSQVKLQESHERSKTVTRSKEMKVIRETMQVRWPVLHYCLLPLRGCVERAPA